MMHIDHIIDKNPLELSGGQVQRVAFGSTFIMEPNIYNRNGKAKK